MINQNDLPRCNLFYIHYEQTGCCRQYIAEVAPLIEDRFLYDQYWPRLSETIEGGFILKREYERDVSVNETRSAP
jgi:hypothetical protein